MSMAVSLRPLCKVPLLASLPSNRCSFSCYPRNLDFSRHRQPQIRQAIDGKFKPREAPLYSRPVSSHHLKPVFALKKDHQHPSDEEPVNLKRGESFEQWDSVTGKFAGAANLPFLLLQLPQIILNSRNLLAGNKSALLAVPWLGMLTGMLGNLSLLSYFIKKRETGAVVVQALGVISFEGMDRYHKVQKPREETSIGENEIRITSQGRMRNYISYAMNLLQEKGSDEIVFKAMGRAINKTVTIVELIKRRIVGLHQIIAIQSIDIIDTWEPLEEGLQTLETTRKVSMVTITLSKKQLDKENIGYQQPIPIDQVKLSTELDYDGDGSPHARGRGQIARGRGRPRPPRGNGFASIEYNDGGYEQNHGYSMGRGRGRARNFRGRGRGGYNGPQVDTQYDSGDYYQDAHRGNGFASVEYNDGGYEQNHGYSMGRDRGRARNFRGRGRGGYNGPQVDTQYDSGDYHQDALRGRGRGRGTRGRGGGFRSNGPVHTTA